MDRPMARTKSKKTKSRRSFSEEFKQEAVQMRRSPNSIATLGRVIFEEDFIRCAEGEALAGAVVE